MVAARIGYSETTLCERIKNVGGTGRPRQRLCETDWNTVRDLGLQSRVVSRRRRAGTDMDLDIPTHMDISTGENLYMPLYESSIFPLSTNSV